MITRQGLLTVAIVLIVIGGIIWLVTWPRGAEPATVIVGQALFWPGIALLILWIIAYAYDELKGPPAPRT